jgi:hypothetical protein
LYQPLILLDAWIIIFFGRANIRLLDAYGACLKQTNWMIRKPEVTRRWNGDHEPHPETWYFFMTKKAELNTVGRITGLLGLALLSTGVGLAQPSPTSWQPQGPLDWRSAFVTTNENLRATFTRAGITYVGFTAYKHESDSRIRSSDASINGTNISQVFVLEKPISPPPIYIVYVQPMEYLKVEPLGALAPGDYRMTWKSFAGAPAVTNVFHEFTFTVPPPSEPLFRLVNDPALAIVVTAVPLAQYVLETSTNLVGWTAMATNGWESLTTSTDLYDWVMKVPINPADFGLPMFFYQTGAEVPFNELKFPLSADASSSSQFFRVQVRSGETERLGGPIPVPIGGL